MAILAMGVISLLLVPSQGIAFTVCSNTAADLCDSTKNAGYLSGSDCDGDGISDRDECEGFTTSAINSINNLYVDGYGSTNPVAPFKVDPAKPDLFYAITSTDTTEIEQMPGSLILGALSTNPNALAVYGSDTTGLNVSTHRILLKNSGAGRTLFPATSYSKARLAWIKESLCVSNCEGTYLGSTPESVPTDDNVFTTIYSQKIKNNVYTNCSGDGKCTVKGTSLTLRDDIVKYYIRQVISHEMGHGSLLGGAPASASSYYHYSKTGTVMDPSITYSRGVYTIPVTFDPVKDPVAAKLVR